MNLQSKIEILAESAKYDVSCSSSGSERNAKKGMIGNTALPGICHSWSSDGRCISLLKILMSNNCVYDCAYCVNRRSNDFRRASFTPEELADITMNFYKRNYIEGLFLSSAVIKNPDYTMEQMIKVAQLLREEKGYNGYIHLKAIPGADHKLIETAGYYADRMSLNLEVPTQNNLQLLAPEKTQEAITSPMLHVKNKIDELAHYNKREISKPFVPAGQTTQLMVGATNDSDLTIMHLSERMYKQMKLKRVYYSAYIPVVKDNNLLPAQVDTPLLREHRLYQADWLLRFYKFNAHELLTKEAPNFDPLLDPKCNWALLHYDKFPIEINRADYYLLLRIPGIGPTSARRIVETRRFAYLNFEDLKKMGVVLKRAQHFILCKGKFYGQKNIRIELLKQLLTSNNRQTDQLLNNQINLFNLYPQTFDKTLRA